MAETEAEDASMNAWGYLNVLVGYLEGDDTPDPTDTRLSDDCALVTEDIVAHDPDMAGMVVKAGLKMCRLLPDQSHWRKCASLAAAILAQKIGGFSPETVIELDEELRRLHEEFPDDTFVQLHWYSLIVFRIAAETAHEPEQAVQTPDRLKSMIGDTKTVTDEHAGSLAHALFVVGISFSSCSWDRSQECAADLAYLTQRFPENEDVRLQMNALQKAIGEATAMGEEILRRRNTPMRRLKRLLGFWTAGVRAGKAVSEPERPFR